MSFFTGLTGLSSASSDLSVVSNNIANANTTGFKGSRAEFSDLYYGASQVGSGSHLSNVSQQFAQGVITSTGNPLDMSISGEGFFRLNDNGNIFYTRAGNFGVDREGYVVDGKGLRLTGYQADAEGEISDIVDDLRIPVGAVEPKITTDVGYGLNLAADAPAIDPAVIPFDPTNPDSFNFSTAVSVFDSLGNGHTLTAYFTKPDATANDWQANFYFNDAAINLTGIDPGNGAANLDLTLDFSDTTQFGGQFATQSLNQNGYASGELSGVEINQEGVLFGRYSNGQAQAIGQVALANFRNTQGLRQVGNSNWVESFDSGQPLSGAPKSGQLGQINSSTLENSNVDLTKELVNMINAQRNFQANAQTIQTADTLAQTIINIR